jgi:Arc/MetJ-type ribon-helix-helix transcriptional regulator
VSRTQQLQITLPALLVRAAKSEVAAGRYPSLDAVVGAGLGQLFAPQAAKSAKSTRKKKLTVEQQMVKGYRVNAKRDEKLAREWNQLDDPWPV